MSTNIGSIQSVNGSFMVVGADGSQSKVDLATLMMMLNIQLTETYDNQIAARMQDMQDRSSNMKKMTEAMNTLRQVASGGHPYSAELVYKAEQALKEAGMTVSNPMARIMTTGNPDGAGKSHYWNTAFCTNNGGDVDKVKNGLDTLIEQVKSSLESMGNDSQLENIKLQNVMQKRGNSFEMTTKVMDTDKQAIQSIIRNL